MAEEKNKTLKKARIEMGHLTGDEEVKRMAWLEEKWEMDRISELSNAEERGIEKGKKEGIKQGKKEGKNEERILIAKKLIEKENTIEDIIELTGLTEEEIEKLI